MRYVSQRIVLALLSLTFAAVLSGSAAALAQDKDSTGSGDNTAGSMSSNGSEIRKSSETENNAHDLLEKYKKASQDKNKVMRQSVKQRGTEVRQKACEARQQAMTNRLKKKIAGAEKHKSTFDAIFTRVKAFHDNKNLDTPGYDDLVSKVNAAQTEAANQIAVLKDADISIDCTQANVADTVSTFREALSYTRDSLKVYRGSLVNLIKAVHESNN